MRATPKILLMCCLLTAGCGGGSGSSNEVLLGRISVGFGGSGTMRPPIENASIWIAVGNNKVDVATGLLNGDTGFYNVAAGSSVSLDLLFAALTDGANNMVCVGVDGNPNALAQQQCKAEVDRYFEKHPELLGPDLEGATITRAQVEVTEATWSNDPMQVRQSFEFSIRLYGTLGAAAP